MSDFPVVIIVATIELNAKVEFLLFGCVPPHCYYIAQRFDNALHRNCQLTTAQANPQLLISIHWRSHEPCTLHQKNLALFVH